MKYVVAFGVLSAAGRPTPLKVSAEVKGLDRALAVRATRALAEQHGIRVSAVPTSIKSVGPPLRKTRLPSL